MTTATSPDFDAARTGLRQWFAALAGLDAAAVQWEDESRSMITGVSGLLTVIADRGYGQPERRHEYDAGAGDGEQIVRRVGQPRALTLSLKLDGYDQRVGSSVLLAMSRVATKIGGDDSIAALRELGFALIDVTGPTNIGREDAARGYPRAVLDVRLGYVRVESESPTTWIERVRVRSHLRDTDGVELPAPPNGTITTEAP